MVLKGSRWYVSWRRRSGKRERETIDMGLDALQMRRMEQQAKPSDGYVSGTYAKGGGRSMQERLLLSMEPRFCRGGQHSLFTRNTYPHFQPDRLPLFRPFQRVLISPLVSRRCQIRNITFLARFLSSPRSKWRSTLQKNSIFVVSYTFLIFLSSFRRQLLFKMFKVAMILRARASKMISYANYKNVMF